MSLTILTINNISLSVFDPFLDQKEFDPFLDKKIK